MVPVIDKILLNEENVLSTLGTRLHEFRAIHLSMDVKPFASIIGVSWRSIVEYEKGANWPGGKALYGYAAQGLNLNWAILGVGKMLSEGEACDARPSAAQTEPVAQAYLLIDAMAARLPPEKRAKLLVIAVGLMREGMAEPVVRQTILQIVDICSD